MDKQTLSLGLAACMQRLLTWYKLHNCHTLNEQWRKPVFCDDLEYKYFIRQVDCCDIAYKFNGAHSVDARESIGNNASSGKLHVYTQLQACCLAAANWRKPIINY